MQPRETLTSEELALLLTEPVQQAIAAARGRDPLEVALDRRIPHARLVATQVKYLARAERKLPTYAAAQCILPPLAFEQASSEACAAHKAIAGDAVLDLTCGLGVDTLFLSRRFRRVVTLERDPVLADVARENFRRLGVGNVEVVTAAAEEYLDREGLRFDWVYADPDRRAADGRRLLRIEECSPDVLALRPRIRAAAARLCLKNSPLFDVDEALRLFSDARVEVVSLHDECKEVMIYADNGGPLLTAVAIGRGEFSARPEQIGKIQTPAFDPGAYHWLFLPDVSLQKARLTPHYLEGRADLWSVNGYGFARERSEAPMGRWMEIDRIEPYNPKKLRHDLKGRKITLLKQDFPLNTAEIASRLGIHPGNEGYIAFTKIGQDYWTIRLK